MSCTETIAGNVLLKEDSCSAGLLHLSALLSIVVLAGITSTT
jgi:hypothetical protein